MSGDRIAIRGIRAFGHHGVLAEERSMGQPFIVDLVLGVDTAPAAAADDLRRTVDYGVVARRVADVVGGEPVDLIETVAGRIAELCLGEPLVSDVEVTVHKPQAPVSVPFDDISVTIHRSRT